MISVNVHTFKSEDSDSLVNSTNFHSPLRFSKWLNSALQFLQTDVECGATHMVHIVVRIGSESFEIHIERDRENQVRVIEYDMTVDAGFFESE